MRLLHLCWLLLLCSLWIAPVYGFDKVVQRTFTVKDGLRSYNINDIQEDALGYVWLATQEGLYRVSNGVLHRVDRQHGKQLLDEQYLEHVRPLNNGDMLVTSQYFVYIYQIKSNRFIKFGTPDLHPQYSGGAVFKLTSDDQDSLYWVTEHGSVWRFSSDSQALTLLFTLPEHEPFYWNQLLVVDDQLLVGSPSEMWLFDLQGNPLKQLDWGAQKDWYSSLARDQLGRVWIGGGNGLYRYYPQSLHIEKMAGISTNISRITSSQDGNLWLIGEGNLLKYSPSNKGVSNRSFELSLQAGINDVSELLLDSNGLLWVSGPSSPLVIIAEPPDFIKQIIELQSYDPLSPHVVWSFYPMGDQLYLGGDGQLNRYNLKQHTAEIARFSTLTSLQSILSINSLDDEHLLLGTSSGLRVMNTISLQEVPLTQWFKESHAISRQLIYHIFREGQQWWFSTSAGLFRWHYGDDNVVPIILPQPSPMDSRAVYRVERDNQQRLWVVGDSSFGYFEQDKFVSVRDKFTEHFSSDISINQVMQVNDDLFWVATREHGILLFDLATGEVRPRNEDWGTDCKTLYFLSHTPNFWIAGCTTKLVRMNRYTGRVEVFSKRDGLIGNELIEGAAWYDPQHGLFVGTPNGAMLLNVAQMHKRVADLAVRIESVTMQFSNNNVDVTLLPQVPLQVLPGARLISFQVTNFDYLSAESFGIKYRIRPVGSSADMPYLMLENQNQINIFGLDAGKYQLEIISKNNDVWQNKPMIFRFDVHLFWWESRWFKWVLLLLLVGSLLGIIAYRHRQVLRFQRINTALQLSDERLRQSLVSSQSDLWEWNAADKQFVIDNHAGILKNPNPIIKRTEEDLPLPNDELQRFRQQWQGLLNGDTDHISEEFRYHRIDGSWGWIRLSGRPVMLDAYNGSVLKIAGIYSEISQQRALETEVNLFALAFENTSEGVIILNEAEQVTVHNAAAAQLLGLTDKQLAQSAISQLIAPVSKVKPPILQLLGTSSSWTGEVNFNRGEQQVFDVWLNISVMRNLAAHQTYYVLVFSDITKRKQAEAELQRLANYDILTGLPNRSYFTQYLQQTLQTATAQQQKFTLLFFDLDKFKHVNDYYGHNMGDALLIEAANRMQQTLGDSNLLSRFGGDEFVALVHSGDKTELDSFCKDILTRLTTPFLLLGRELSISSSIGLSIWPDDTQDIDSLMKFADQAMYLAKESGRANFKYYSAALSSEVLYEMRLEQHLHKAFARNELQLNYQPIFDAATQQIVGLEAVVSWCHSQDGLIEITLLRKVAEACGLTNTIDCWELEQACRQTAHWSAAFGQPFNITVNIEPQHFRQADFIGNITAILLQTGLPPSQLTIEISEIGLVKDIEVSLQHFRKLHQMGTKVVIDDFGTGYSPLGYLRRFQLGGVKIASSFLVELETNSADQAIVYGLIALATRLKVPVIADGVSSDAQVEILTESGCRLMQGSYFSPPLSVAEMSDKLTELSNKND